ncbi:MAG: RidA family protein [Thermoplasmataceae archaeon]
MSKKIVNADEDVKGKLFSDSTYDGKTLYISGQIGTDDGSDNSFESQFKRIMAKINNLLNKVGMSTEDILKINVYLTDRKYFAEMNRLFSEFFHVNPPARATIITSLVSDKMLVELDAIASK